MYNGHPVILARFRGGTQIGYSQSQSQLWFRRLRSSPAPQQISNRKIELEIVWRGAPGGSWAVMEVPVTSVPDILHGRLKNALLVGWDCEIRNQWGKPVLMIYLIFVFSLKSRFFVFIYVDRLFIDVYDLLTSSWLFVHKSTFFCWGWGGKSETMF